MSVTQLLSAPVGFRKRLYFPESRGPDGGGYLGGGVATQVFGDSVAALTGQH